jgi:hypothetical protein
LQGKLPAVKLMAVRKLVKQVKALAEKQLTEIEEDAIPIGGPPPCP